MTASLRIRVDQSICAGHALCATKAPELYVLDEDGYCVSDGRLVPAGHEDAARLGAAVCPERAITLVDEPAS